MSVGLAVGTAAVVHLLGARLLPEVLTALVQLMQINLVLGAFNLFAALWFARLTATRALRVA